MYHIKEDKRSKVSAILICEGLDRCLLHKPFQKITITDVQKESTVGRATFYRLFDSLSDVLLYQCDEAFSQLLPKKEQFPVKNKISFIHFIEFWMQQSNLLETIVDSGHIEIIYQSHQKNADKLKNFLPHQNNMDETQTNYMVGILTYIMLGILAVWIKHGKKETADELVKIAEQAILSCYQTLQ